MDINSLVSAWNIVKLDFYKMKEIFQRNDIHLLRLFCKASILG